MNVEIWRHPVTGVTKRSGRTKKSAGQAFFSFAMKAS